MTVQGAALMTPVLVNPGTAANFGVAATGGDDLATVEERVGHRHGLIEQSTRIAAQVENDAAHRSLVLLVEVLDGGGERLTGVLLELGDAEIGVARFDQFVLDALDLDDGTRQRDDERFLFVLAHHGQRDLRIRAAAHFLHGVVQRHALD